MCVIFGICKTDRLVCLSEYFMCTETRRTCFHQMHRLLSGNQKSYQNKLQCHHFDTLNIVGYQISQNEITSLAKVRKFNCINSVFYVHFVERIRRESERKKVQ